MKTNFITQFDVTFTFDKEYEVGKFADGSYWVLGPVTIISITPDFTGTRHGWEVNPTIKDPQGFTSATHFFDPSLVPALPYTATTTQSIVKTISGYYRQSHIKTAVVLTVVTEIPENNGATVFRPPYIGTEKPMYKVSDLQTQLLPKFAPVGTPPTLEAVIAKFSQCLRMDHHRTYPRFFRPYDCMWDYQPGNINDVADAMLRLMLDDPIEQKLPALIQLTQPCIDRLYAMMLGYRTGSTGHNPGHRTMAAWAAVMLNIPEGKEYLMGPSQNYQELQFLTKRGSMTLWGQNASEFDYWKYLQGGGGNQSNADPYNYVDGGRLVTTGSGGPGGAYQKIVSQNIKAGALISILMPEMAITWRPGHGELVKEYSDRWVNHGVWAEPDPVAPYTSDGVYKVDYGPDPANPGQAILGSGRFPGLHGLNKDGGQYKSQFVKAMWDAYRNTIVEPPPPEELPPSITTHPQDVNVDENGNAVFAVEATGTGTLSYQWKKDGVAIDGEISTTLSISNVALTDAGEYTVLISNDFGAVETVPAILTVNALPPPPLPMKTIYIAQTELGNGDGSSPENAKSVDWFNDPLNWSSIEDTVGQISPGDTVIITGTISTPLTFQKSGLENAPITLLFGKDAKFSSPYSSRAIQASDKNYLIIDGGENGIIENTDNGTSSSFGNSGGSIMVLLESCSYCDVKNLTIRNVYVRTDTADTSFGGAGIKVMPKVSADTYTKVRVFNCVVSDVQDGIYFMYRPSGPNNLEVFDNTIFNINHGIKFGDGGVDSRLYDVVIKNNKIYDFAKWDEPASNKFHHDGIFVFATNSGSEVHNVEISNNSLGGGYGKYATAGVYLSGWIFNALIKNNKFFAAGANGMLCLRLRDQSTAKVYNNVFVSSNYLYNSAIYLNGQDGGLKYVQCRNNIFISLRTPYNVSYSGAWSLDIDYSLMYDVHPTQTISYSSSSTGSFRTFAGWQSMGYDLNSIYGQDPLLDSEGKLLAGSPAIGKGENLSAIFTDDAAGLIRTDPWDMGQYKYVGTTEPQPYPPVITKQPVSVNAFVGDSVSFTVEAIGLPEPSYQWRKNEIPLDGEINETLSIDFASLEDSGDYDVVVTNTEGSIESNSVSLVVEEPLPEEFAPEITVQPQDLTVEEGQTITLSLSATGNPEPTCQWYKSDGSAILNGNSFTLTINSASLSDSGDYFAIVSNSKGNVSSNVVTVTVNTTPVEELPVIIKQPVSKSVSEGADITFSVTATSSSPMTYQWDRNGNVLTGKTGSSMMLNDVKLSDTGTYSVTITNAAGSIVSDGASLTVSTAQTPPFITVHPVSKTVRMKDTVVFTVVATGNPTPSYQWYKNGIAILGANSTEFFITNVKNNDSGVYTVRISNYLGIATSDDAELIVITGK